jgi:hypothetical protein
MGGLRGRKRVLGRRGWNLERRRRSQSGSGRGRDEEAGFGGGTGDWESRIERDEGIDTGSKVELKTLMGSEEGKGEGRDPKVLQARRCGL